jgi:hypothetical protein
MNALGLIYQEDKEKIENSWQETFAQDIQQANYDEDIFHYFLICSVTGMETAIFKHVKKYNT